MSKMIMYLSLTYSTSGIACGEKVCRDLKMTAILKISKYETQLQFYLPKPSGNYFHRDFKKHSSTIVNLLFALNAHA